MEKIKIEPGTVQETLLIPLYGRKQAMDRYPDIFMDHDCQEIFSHVNFQVSDQMSGKIGKRMPHILKRPSESLRRKPWVRTRYNIPTGR